jgi:hypothetical protein
VKFSLMMRIGFASPGGKSSATMTGCQNIRR